MSNSLPLRLIIASLLSIGLAVLLLLFLYATDIALSVWQRLSQGPTWFMLGYAAVFTMLALAALLIIWRVAFPRRARRAAGSQAEPPAPPSESEVVSRLERAMESGADVVAAEQELRDLRERRQNGEVFVSLYGRVSTGKSSLVKALLPAARPEIDPRAGTTRSLNRYTWQSPAGDRLILVDVPGVNEPDGNLSELAREEAIRAHVVIYLCDGDLTRDQYEELSNLSEFGKPLIVAINKADLYSEDDLDLIRSRVRERLATDKPMELVAVTAGARREVMVVHPDGREELVQREMPPRAQELVQALQAMIDSQLDTLEHLRDAAVFVLAGKKIDASLARHRQMKSEEIVSGYTKKAVIGALAAVTPGTDVLIQGYLGVRLVKELTQLYEVPASQVDTEKVLTQASKRVGKALPITLAVTGNALKAFPGMGTLAGGITHAVAYGLLFDSLGGAIAKTLESRGNLPPKVVSRTFEEALSEDLETRARRLAKLALAQVQGSRKDAEQR